MNLCPNMKVIEAFLKKQRHFQFFHNLYEISDSLPTKPSENLFWAWKRPKFFMEHAKLNFRRVKKSAGLRPAPIFHFSRICAWGGSFNPPSNKNRVKEN